jgi:hypothetical protein
LYDGFLNDKGYGNSNGLVHRQAYEAIVGPVPDGKLLHHTCETPACYNPAHLTPVTHAEHAALHPGASMVGTLRGAATQRSKTQCPKGHPYNAENTYIRPSGARKCRACNADRERARA